VDEERTRQSLKGRRRRHDMSRNMLIPPQVNVIAAGGIYDGRGLAAMLMYGAQAVWVGTRFVAATEAAAPKKHKDL
jgi:NAD(P)H-dependent flavin oxidoreductase YrpB (nitropropane dioxygenase family)